MSRDDEIFDQVRLQKAALRKKMRAMREQVDPVQKKLFDEAIGHRVIVSSVFESAQSILVYFDFSYEISTELIIRQALLLGKSVAAPVTKRGEQLIQAYPIDCVEQVHIGDFGMREPLSIGEPIAVEAFDLVIMPGLAFTHQGDRLGYGGGYYDRYLLHSKPSTVTMALAYDFQLVSDIPVQAFDIRVHRIITPTADIECMV